MTTDALIIKGDCLNVMAGLPDGSIDAIVTDPPYGLGFMGKNWDHSVPGEAFWREALRVAKPGCHILAAGGTRTYHRLAVAIEDAGWEIRDCIMWLYGSGFPKSLDVSKAIDRMKDDRHEIEQVVRWMEETRQRTGVTRKQVEDCFGTINIGQALFTITPGSTPRVPTLEQVDVLLDLFGLTINDVPDDIHRLLIDKNATKGQPGPNWFKREVVGHFKSTLGGTVAAGERNLDIIEEHRNKVVPLTAPATDAARQWSGWGTALKPAFEPFILARKPLDGTVAENVLKHGTGGINVDGCRVEGEMWKAHRATGLARHKFFTSGTAEEIDKQPHAAGRWPANVIHDGSDEVVGLAGDAARFFYTAKASRDARSDGNTHPTVKPTDLMRYLCRLVTPPGGLILDPFCGSGSTGVAAVREGFNFIGIELNPEYAEIARRRIDHERNKTPLFSEVI